MPLGLPACCHSLPPRPRQTVSRFMNTGASGRPGRYEAEKVQGEASGDGREAWSSGPALQTGRHRGLWSNERS